VTTFLRFLTYCVFIFGPSAIIAQVTQTATYNYTGATQTFIVPVGVTSINVNGSGAQGGNTGANGARIIGDFAVTAGDVVTIMVGGQGATQANNVGGGGGGTFIWNTTTGNTLYVAAGGGGGRAGNSNSSQGGVGSATNTPTNSINGSGNATSGASGNGGSGGSAGAGGSSGGGAGWFSNGTNGAATTYVGGGGIRPLLGGNGGSSVNSGCGAIPFGGYGGGGGGGGCSGAGGGGGGYNGGGGGNGWNGSTWGSGAGGGSYNSGSNQVNSAGVQSGNGQVIISYLSPCSPSYTNGCALGDYINNFSTSGGTSNISNLATGCSAGAYGDFTSQTHTSAFGSTVSFSLQSGATYSQGYSIWVDWDQDNVFEANELMWSSSTWTTAVVNGSFDIPFAIPKTSYRMRVRCAYNTIPTDPCANYGFGEVEEYELVVTSPYCSPLFTTGCAVGDQIENFSTTGGTTNITNNGSGCNGTVADFTSLVHTGAEGDTVNFTVQAGPVYAQGFGIWVDVNQNGIFEGAEQLWNSGTWSTAAFNGSFIIPCGSDTGATIMRVVATYNAVPTNPCLSATYGEAEEYTLQLNPDATAPNVNTYASLTLPLDANGSAFVDTNDIDSATTDACNFTRSVARSNIAGYETQVQYLGALNGHSYFLTNASLSKTAAQTLASNMGGYLASITSAAENDFITSLASNPALPPWIGLSDAVSEGTFVWDNGEPVSYTNWTVGEPNNSGNEDCVQLYLTGTWNDVSCAGSYPAVIEVNDTMAFADRVFFSCADTGTQVVYLQATDDRGNVGYDITQVDVSDNTGPVISASNFTLYLDSFGEAYIPDSLLDGTTPSGTLYFTGTNSNRIWEADMTTGAAQILLNSAAAGTQGPVGIDYSIALDSVYFAGGNYSEVYRIAADGSGSKYSLPNAAVASVYERHEVYIDDANNRIFFTAGDDGIFVGNLDGTGTATNLINPTTSGSAGMDYDPSTDLLIFSDITNNRIESMRGDGSEYQILYDAGDGVSNARQVVIDGKSGTVYWANRGTGSIMAGSVDGSSVATTLYTGQTGIYGIDYFAPSDMLYWTRFGGSDQIYRAPADGSGTPELVLSSNYGSIRGLTTRAMYPAGVFVSDNCGVASYTVSADTFYCANIGSNTITINALDISGNSSSSTVDVNVLDTIIPLALGKDTTVFLDAFGSVVVPSASMDSASYDNCGLSFALSDSAFSCADVGTNLVWFYAIDPSGNVDSVQVAIEVVDTVAPDVITQDINLWLDASGSALITGVDVDNGSSDACGIASLAVNITNFSCVDVGTPVTVTLTVTDSNGNADSATAVVTVLDTVLPNVIAKNVTVILDSLGSVTIPADSMDNGSSDACGILLINANDTVFDCSDVGSPVQVVLNVADVNTNFDTAHAYVTVLDQAIPALHAYNALTVYLDVNGQYTLTSAEMDSASFDACGIAYTLDTFNFDCNNHAAPVMVTLTGTDPSGNTSSDSTLVTVLDTLPPNVVTQNITIALDSFGARLIDSSNVDLGSWDACGIQELWVEQEMFSCADIGVNTLWYYGLDIHGNLDSVSIDITVIDAIAPIIDIIDTFYVSLDSFGFASMTADSIDIGSWDNCCLASIIIDTASFNCGNHGDTLTVTFTATDVNGNVSVDTSIFIINDTIAPAIFAHSDTFYLDSNGVFTFDAIGLNDSTQDACGVDTFYLSDTLVTCASVDSTIDIYFYAVDIYGNVDSQILNITALDTIRPVITCLDSIVVDNDIDVCGAVVEFNWPTATDNCTVDSIVQIDTTGLDSNSFFPVGITQLTYVAYDQSGNTDTCSFIIEVIDWQTPQLLCQSDTLICDSTFTFVYPAYIDNCSGIDVVQVAGIASGDFYPVGSTINRFAVTDSYGNTDTCEYEVFRYDFPSLADAGPDQEKCEEYTGTLAGNTPGVGFGFWSMLVGEASIADSTNPASTISGITVGTTVFEWRIENGVCPIERDTMEIIEYLNPTAANAGLDIILCDTTEAILGAILDTIGTGTWLPASNGTTISDTAAFNSIVTGLSLGTYNYVWKVANGVCSITYDSVQLDVKPYTAVDAGKDRYIFNPSNIALTATSTLQPVTYTWSPASSLLTTDGDSVMAAPRETMDFIVTAETEFGCKTRDTVMVGINIGPVLPTAFTPDGDNYNDVWNLKELESYPGCVVKVYNRWGYEIFTSKGYKDSWDGTDNGEALPSGSYFYVIELNVEEVPPQTGSVTIIK